MCFLMFIAGIPIFTNMSSQVFFYKIYYLCKSFGMFPVIDIFNNFDF